MGGRWRYRLENGLVYLPPSFSTLAMAVKKKKGENPDWKGRSKVSSMYS